MTGRALRIDRADLTTDIGSISVAGSFDSSEPFEKVLERPGSRLEADVDLAMLARALPKSMRVRDRTEIREGKLFVRLESRSAPNGTDWIGKIDASSLKALRDGKEVRWEDPLAVEFAGRFRSGHLPTFDKLICRSDFIALQAEVKPDSILRGREHLPRSTGRPSGGLRGHGRRDIRWTRRGHTRCPSGAGWVVQGRWVIEPEAVRVYGPVRKGHQGVSGFTSRLRRGATRPMWDRLQSRLPKLPSRPGRMSSI